MLNSLKFSRVAAGWYRAMVGETEIEIISHRVFREDAPAMWNLMINGRCDDAYHSKRDATEAAIFVLNQGLYS